MGFRKGRQYATTWMEKAERISHRYSSSKYTEIECYLEALKRDPEYAEAWCGLGSEITGMGASEDTDKELVGMDLFKDEPKITDDKRLHYAHINAAKFCFDKAIEIEPKYVDAWYQKGSWYNSWLYMEKEKIECFLEVTKLDPKHKTAWFDLANAYSSYTSEYAKAVKCYDEAIALSPDNLHVVYAKKADLLSECVKNSEWWYRTSDSDLKKKYSSGKDALMCYDKALEIKPKYGYASYKKGMLLERLSRYEEALECFENNGGYDRENGVPVMNSNKLHRLALRDKLKPHEAGSTESFEIYCNVLKNFFKDDELSEVEYARKKLNENILQHIHKLPDHVTEEDVYEMGEWLQSIGREKEALELYDKEVEESLERGDLYNACEVTLGRTYRGKDKDVYEKDNLYNKIIQFCEKFESLDYDKRAAAFPVCQDVDWVAERLTEAYERKADIFAGFGNMDKAIECIDHAIKLEREHPFEEYRGCWQQKMKWLPDEEAIKFIDEEIKAVNSMDPKRWYDDEEDKKEIIQGLESRKNELLNQFNCSISIIEFKI